LQRDFFPAAAPSCECLTPALFAGCRAPLKEMLAQIHAGKFPPPSTWNARRDVQLAHLPGKRVSEALSAVTMKCLEKAPGDRYANVAALQQDIAAYQGGFATEAEDAGPARQFWLLVQRHRAVFRSVAAAVVLLFAITTVYLVHLQKTLDREKQATKRAEDATARAEKGEEDAKQQTKLANEATEREKQQTKKAQEATELAEQRRGET